MKLNPPFASDTVARVTSVPTCTNTRLALGTAAPVASCTTPVTPPLNCAKETLAEKAATRNTKKQRNPVVNLIQFPPTSILTNLARPENAFRARHGYLPTTGPAAMIGRFTKKANASSSTTFRENVYFLLRAIYIRFSNRVKRKFGCNSIFTLRACLLLQYGGCFRCLPGSPPRGGRRNGPRRAYAAGF